MSPEPTTVPRPSPLRAARHHVLVVVLGLVAGIVAGWLLASAQPAAWSSTAHVLVNPTVGNPFAPAPSSVRQDELTSLETEAQVARSAEVLGEVATGHSPLTLRELQQGARVSVPPNTQILELTYTAGDPALARKVADAWADAYLANRDQRSQEVNADRVARVESQTQRVVDDLRKATAAAQTGGQGQRQFQTQLAGALRNELVSLRAQRSYLDNSEAPAGSVISGASGAARTDTLLPLLLLVGTALAGLVLGWLVAIALERRAGVVRSASEVEDRGLPVLAAAPAPVWGRGRRRRAAADGTEATIRRLRAQVLALEPAPDIIAVAPAGSGRPHAPVAEAVADSFAKAGHRVVLVRTGGPATSGGLGVEERGLSEALLHDRLNVLEMLQPSVEPLLCLLPWGSGSSSDLLVGDRLRTVLRPLVEAGHLVVLQSPGIDSAEGEAVVGAADLGLVVVTTGRTRARDVAQVTSRPSPRATPLAALVVDPRSVISGGRHASEHDADEPAPEGSLARDPASRSRR